MLMTKPADPPFGPVTLALRPTSRSRFVRESTCPWFCRRQTDTDLRVCGAVMRWKHFGVLSYVRVLAYIYLSGGDAVEIPDNHLLDIISPLVRQET